MLTRRQFLKAGMAAGAGLLLPLDWAVREACADSPGLAKFVDALPVLSPLVPQLGVVPGADYYEIGMNQIAQKLHRDLDPTQVWAYLNHYPGPLIVARRNRPTVVKWINNLPTTPLLTVDQTIHGAQPPNPLVRTVVHLHGGNVPPDVDGYPEDWYTPGNYATYRYPNIQQAAPLWFHDHALGFTRGNVYSGLAGLYILKESCEDKLKLPSGAYDIGMVIQDKTFNADGSLFFPAEWEPEFFGDTVLVNGMVWPYLETEPRKYRFRLYDGSNARFYRLRLVETDQYGTIQLPQGSVPPVWQIGTDGGLLPKPVPLSQLIIGPGERAELVVDFSQHYGKHFMFFNDAEIPFGDGSTSDGAIPEVMLFHVTKPLAGLDTSKLPCSLRSVTRLQERNAVKVRSLTLEEAMDMNGRMMILLNGMMWDDPVTENPKVNTTEVWRLLNLTPDTHPIHLHQVQFQILDRQAFDADHYMATGEVVYLGPKRPPDANERGWKDTGRVPPGHITRYIAKFGPYTGRYVWHCHIIDHEDNEMMRPYDVIP